MALTGQVCLVTGATRGIGKGIALQLGKAGATVYVTGRTLDPVEGTSGCLRETAKEIEALGGKCIPVQCDHSKDDEVDRLFDQINTEQDGRLDVLVNNAFSAVSFLGDVMSKKIPFWEQSPDAWDIINNVGLRNHYRCSVLGARMMVARRQGLIVVISGAAGIQQSEDLFNVASGVGKAACDRMATDCAIELRRHNVTYVSLCPGLVLTELVESYLKEIPIPPNLKRYFREGGETPDFVGKAVASLASDSKVILKSGLVLLTADLADEYGYTDINGRTPWNPRCIWVAMSAQGYDRLAAWIPGWLKVPRSLLALGAKKF